MATPALNRASGQGHSRPQHRLAAAAVGPDHRVGEDAEPRRAGSRTARQCRSVQTAPRGTRSPSSCSTQKCSCSGVTGRVLASIFNSRQFAGWPGMATIGLPP